MRTDWAGSSMKIGEIQNDYQPTVGAFTQSVRENQDVMRSDPAKVAQAIIQVTKEKEPPLRLLLGSDAAFLAPLISAARAEEDAKWKPLSLTTDLDGLTDFSETPIAKMMMPKQN